MNLVSLFHQPIHQPVPVKRRLHHDAHQFPLKRLKRLPNQTKIIRQLLLENPLALLINDPKKIVVAMKITSCV